MKILAELARDLRAGATSSRALVEECLDRIVDTAGEGQRTFVKVHADTARVAADYYDRLRAHGIQPSPYAGIPVSIKDLFDLAGDVTTAGSTVLRDQPPAEADAPAIARLRAAGFIPIGRTNMTEFAYSGLGVNPHYGTPLNPFERDRRRIPGGSSSGAAISITEQMCHGAVGTDTGGSCRIPAAFCGITGFKPTQRRVPLAGVFPLSQSLDSVGPLAASVGCCAILDAFLAAESSPALDTREVRGARLAVPQRYVMDNLDPHVARSFGRALSQLSKARAELIELPLAELDAISRLNAKGGFAAAEAYALHRQRLDTQRAQIDPRVSMRILRGREQSAADYIDLFSARADLKRATERQLAPFDAVVLPTCATVAPMLEELESDEEYIRLNLLAVRNSTVVNLLDRCAVSIPCQEAGSAPVGLTLMGPHGGDRALLALAAAVEPLISPRRT
jgi:aspartyl-tRNA(Asn)/glutamyl-tRNA(Gln) amidotransferase subunit A